MHFLRDVFSWDNENRVLKCFGSDFGLSLVQNKGLENKITDYFQNLRSLKYFLPTI